ncbi:MMPL family transporter [Pelomonas sp. SE-A7]|uniref:efflux RND transporter permease subunit n=1 Tax=Pelomonas sp. SE-A7 TaxID=3054953 RepID=UPI00259D1E51|nr:MMPL family transporter [Pelomonas sp. SE-A7]MDM4765042.1 MMPL family transporter [Pelomonas sp. SE-A7]
MAISTTSSEMPVVRDLADFPRHSGSWLERAVFNRRRTVLFLCALATLILGFMCSKVALNASFEKMIPTGHPYIQNFLQHRKELRGMGNQLRIVVENPGGSVYEAAYLDKLKRLNDELFLTPGVDRAWVKSLWLPTVRWTEVTEEGFNGGPVMPDGFDGSADSIAKLRLNAGRANLVGSLIANDLKSSAIVLPLLERQPDGSRLNYWQLSKDLDSLRAKYEAEGLKVRIIGFAKIVGDLLAGLLQVALYFGVAIVIAALLLFGYTRCMRSTALVLACSLVAVVWQIGLLAIFKLELDPYSMLVPFLVFAIGVSHGAQKMNGIMQDIARGTHRLVAARYTFRRLFLAGVTALLADAVGFAVLVLIPIPVIRELAMTASIGVAVLVFTNLLLLPVLLSFVGVSPRAARRALETEQRQLAGHRGLWVFLDHFAERRSWAAATVIVSLALGVAGFVVSQRLQIGDLDPGAPELRPNSRYNQDNAYVTSHYALSSDVFAVIVKTPAEGCLKYETLDTVDQLAWELQQLPQVRMTLGLQDVVRQITAGSFEGNPKWLTISRNQDVLNYGAQQASVNNPDMFNTECSVMPLVAFLADHKAETLTQVLATTERFIAEKTAENKLDPAKLQLLPAAGGAGIEAATNIVVKQANTTMLLYVYAAVILLCLVTFRSWRATVVAVLPLVLTSILCEALMVWLGIGVKVATLPVIALGVGIGVDYALYLLSVQLAGQRRGLTLSEAYGDAVLFTGRVVALVGVTLAAGVITWAFSPIKFQADMGVLLTFMFLWNMVGALVLIPALSHFLLNDKHIKVA